MEFNNLRCFRITLPALAALTWIVVFFTNPEVAAETLTLDTVMARALAHAQELQIAKVDLDISKYSLEEVRSLYYPSLTARFDTEYLHVYNENEGNQVSVGDYVSTSLDSAYQNAFTLRLTYDLYQFGTRPLKFENAERDVRIASIKQSQETLQMQLTILDIYRQGLILQKKRDTVRNILGHRKEIYRHGQRLQKAGKLGEQQVMNHAVDLAEEVSRGDRLDSEYQTLLNALGRYTGVSYDLMATRFVALADSAAIRGAPDPQTLPEILAIEEEIRKKENEYAISRKEMLPRFYFSGAHRMYGRDDANYIESLQDLEGRDASFAVYAEWNLFSGFRDVSKSRRLKMEIARLRLERDKQIEEVGARIRSLYDTYQLNTDRSENRLLRTARIAASNHNLERMSTQQIVDRIAALEKEIELMQQQMDVDIQQTEQAAAALELTLYQEGGAS